MKYLIHSKLGDYICLKNNLDNVNHSFVELSDKQYNDVVKAKANKKTIKVFDGELVFSEQDLVIKREEITKERDRLIDVVGRYIDRPTYTNKLCLTSEDLEDVEELYYRLLDMPQHYDASTDKHNWSYKWVDEYTSGKNTNTYQLKILPFIKW